MEILSLILGPILAMVLGFIWYHPKVFGNIWMKSVGLTEQEVNSGPGLGYLYTFILSFILTATISSFANFVEISNLIDGIGLGLMLGFGFVLPIMLPSYIFARKDAKLIGIDVFYQFLNVLIISIVVSIF